MNLPAAIDASRLRRHARSVRLAAPLRGHPSIGMWLVRDVPGCPARRGLACHPLSLVARREWPPLPLLDARPLIGICASSLLMELLAGRPGATTTETGIDPVGVRGQIWVGIDIGKTTHHACAVDDSGEVIFSQRLQNAQAVIEALIARADAASNTVRWAVDITSGTAALLLALLHSHGCTVQYVPGKLVNRMSGAFAGEGKTDAKDARTIAETARLRSDLSIITPPDALIVQLQVLTSHRDDLKADWVRGVNRLRALQAGFFPALEAALDYSTLGPLILLTGLQTPAQLRHAGTDAVQMLLLEHGAVVKTASKIAAKALAAAAEQTVTLPTEAISAPLVAHLAGELLNLDRQVRELDKQIVDRFNRHEHAPRITSVIGFGPILGAQLLADTDGDPLRVSATPARLAAYAGSHPYPETQAAYGEICAARSGSTADYDTCSRWPRSSRSISTAHRATCLGANAPRASGTPKP
jgi:transposase